MKILALYQTQTLSLMRRVLFPFSTLSQRAHSFNFLYVESFTSGMSFAADVIVIQNWRLTEEELVELERVVHNRAVVVDCSDPVLLHDDLYRDQMARASLVTVPNAYMCREAKHINANSAIVPSCVDISYFAQANAIKLDKKNHPITIGCLGPYDWDLVKDALIEINSRHKNLVVCAGRQAGEVLRDTGIRGVEPEITMLSYPEIVHSCTFGLAPLDGESAIDRIWEHEYGALCKPVILSRSRERETWTSKIEEMITNPKRRADAGHDAFQLASNHRARKLAGEYLSVYKKRLPHLFLQ